MTGNCLCGAVSITIDAKPEFINDCNCSLCRKVGGAWGYFAPSSVQIAGKTTSFTRRDKTPANVEVHSCETCAVTTHWVLTKSFQEQNPSFDQMGVNMRLFDPNELNGVEVRFPDGKAWAGEGPFGYRRTALMIDDSTPW